MKRVVPSARNWEFGIEHLSDLGLELLARRATEGNLFYGGGGEVPSNMQKRRLKVETKETSLKSRGSALTAAASYLKRLSLSGVGVLPFQSLTTRHGKFTISR
jgi:hypothetical protein